MKTQVFYSDRHKERVAMQKSRRLMAILYGVVIVAVAVLIWFGVFAASLINWPMTGY